MPMNIQLRRVVAVTALMIGTTATAQFSSPHPGDMTRYQMPGYTLIAVDNRQLRRDMLKLPKLKRALELSTGIDSRNTGVPTYFYVVSSSIWDRYLESSTGIVGEFVPTRFANYVLANNVEIDRRGLFHEHAHLYLYNQMPGVYPLWFDEGLAEMFAAAEYSGDTMRIFPRSGSDEFNWLPIQRVLRAEKTSPEYLDERLLHGFHYQSRVMVQRALADDHEFGKRVFKYLAAINELKTPDEAEKELGPLAEVDSRMHDYVNELGLKTITLKLDSVTELKLPAGEAVSKLDTLLGLATVCLDTARGIDHAHELLDAADKLPGGPAHTLPLRMRLAARRQDDTTLDQLNEMLGSEPGDAIVASVAGMALFERAEALDAAAPRRTELLNRSFFLLNRSLSTRPDDPGTVWTFAMAAAALNRDVVVALTRLVPMIERLPGNPDLAQAAVLLLAARGEKNVLPFLTAISRNARSLEQKRWAVDRMNAGHTGAGNP
jgi:hypothetical protein